MNEISTDNLGEIFEQPLGAQIMENAFLGFVGNLDAYMKAKVHVAQARTKHEKEQAEIARKNAELALRRAAQLTTEQSVRNQTARLQQEQKEYEEAVQRAEETAKARAKGTAEANAAIEKKKNETRIAALEARKQENPELADYYDAQIAEIQTEIEAQDILERQDLQAIEARIDADENIDPADKQLYKEIARGGAGAEAAKLQLAEQQKAREETKEKDEFEALVDTLPLPDSMKATIKGAGPTALNSILPKIFSDEQSKAELDAYFSDLEKQGVPAEEIAKQRQITSSPEAIQDYMKEQRDIKQREKEATTAHQRRVDLQEDRQKHDKEMEQIGSGKVFNPDKPQALSDDEWKRLQNMRADPQIRPLLTRLGEIQGGYDTGIQGYIDGKTGTIQGETESEQNPGFSLADMAMINGFQRMIDPGVSVREGDVHAMLGTAGLSEQLTALLQRVAEEGGRFSDTLRDELGQMIINHYNSNIRGTYSKIHTAAERLLPLSGLQDKITINDVVIPYAIQTLTLNQILEQGHGGIPGITKKKEELTAKPKSSETESVGGLPQSTITDLADNLRGKTTSESIIRESIAAWATDKTMITDLEAVIDAVLKLLLEDDNE